MKGPSLFAARHSFGRRQNCKRLPSTSVTSTFRHLVSALNAFGLFARVARPAAENVQACLVYAKRFKPQVSSALDTFP
jgi:hypothetical protein